MTQMRALSLFKQLHKHLVRVLPERTLPLVMDARAASMLAGCALRAASAASAQAPYAAFAHGMTLLGHMLGPTQLRRVWHGTDKLQVMLGLPGVPDPELRHGLIGIRTGRIVPLYWSAQ